MIFPKGRLEEKVKPNMIQRKPTLEKELPYGKKYSWRNILYTA